MTEKKSNRRGRAPGTGKWGVKTHTVRVPEGITTEGVQALVELYNTMNELSTHRSPFLPGSVRDKAWKQCRSEVQQALEGLGLS